MDNKIMRVYYGIDGLPYKDKERTVHYPIAGKVGGGSVITGENNTTTIEFYVGLVGSNSKTYVATIKKPSGTLLYRVLSAGVSTDDDYYVSLDIAEIYANEVGNLVVGLNGYDGNTNITTDDDDLVINGNTTCIALGTINILCNYAPQVLTNAYGLDPSDLQLLLTEINKKADKLYTIVVVNQLNSTLEFDNNQIVFSIADKKFYKYVDSDTYPNNFVVATDYYSTSEIDALLSGKQNTLVSGTNIKTINGESILGSGNINIQGGGGATYTAGNGITIDAQNKISADITESNTNGYVKVGANNIKVYDDTNLREVAEGKCKAYCVNGNFTIADVQTYINDYGYHCYDSAGNDITQDVLDDYYDDKLINGSFIDDVEGDYLSVGANDYIVIQEYTGIPPAYFKWVMYNVRNDLHKGDLILVYQVDHPDWWFDATSNRLYRLETTKVDLTNYATIGYVDTELAKKLSITFSGASEYNTESTGYSVGDRFTYGGRLYRVISAISVGDDFDSNKCVEITLNDYPTKAGDETITGNWTFNGTINPNASSYGLTLPDTTGFTADSEVIDTTSNQTITGQKTFTTSVIMSRIQSVFNASNYISLETNDISINFSGDLYIAGNKYIMGQNDFSPNYANKDLGKLGTNKQWRDLYLSRNLTDGTNNVTVADISNGIFNVINASAIENNQLSADQLALVLNGKITRIAGTYRNYNDLIILGVYDYSESVYLATCFANETLSVWSINKTNGGFGKESATFGRTVLDSIKTINGISITQHYKKPQASVSLSDGGTITDSTLKTLIQNEQPIKLNGFTCYFSCDDGTNYQYTSMRYDSNSNKNHINVITINKTTWVATFHTSDIALN